MEKQIQNVSIITEASYQTRKKKKTLCKVSCRIYCLIVLGTLTLLSSENSMLRRCNERLLKVSRFLNYEKHSGKCALLCCFENEPGELVIEVLLKRDLKCSCVSTITFETSHSFICSFHLTRLYGGSILISPGTVLGAEESRGTRQGCTIL